MKWIALKLKNLPIISLEVERALEVFESMVTKFSSQRKRDEFIQISDLANQFRKRVAELDAFYKDHYLQDNIAIFHMLKIKLQKALFKINQLAQQKPNQQSFKDDSLSLFPETEIKLLQQPLFRYYQSPTRKATKEDYFQFAKNAPKEQMSSFGQKSKPISSNNQISSSRPEQTKAQLPYTSNQMGKNKILKEEVNNFAKKPIPATNKNIIKKNEKKVSVAYKTATFTSSNLQKVEQQKQKQVRKGNSPEGEGKMIQGNFLQCLNNQNELKFTIKMTKEQYKQLLQIKKKISQEGRH